MKNPTVSLALFAGVALLAYPLLSASANPTGGSSLFFAMRQHAQIVPTDSGSSLSAPAAGSGSERRTKRAMDRMKQLFGTGASISLIRPPSALTQAPTSPYNRMGVYLTSGSVSNEAHLDDVIDQMKKSGGNAVIFDVKGSRVYFETTSTIAADLHLVKAVEDLPAIIKKLHDNGFYVMGRFIAIKDPSFTAVYPAASVRSPVTNAVLSQDWVDPSNEYAQEYNMQVLCDLAKSGIDEVNFDYIRFSTQNYVSLSVFTAQQKADKVYSFISKARDTINTCGASTKLGISTYAILGWNYPVNLATLGQDFVRFAPLVDVISPMAYPATFSVDGGYWNPAKNKGSRMYYLVYRTLTGYEALLGDQYKGKIRPWIQGYSVTKQNVEDEIQAVHDAGLCGFQFWNAGNNYQTVWSAMAASKVPATCVTE